ncbi:VanZ family protein [uncultured Chryseobacterium sp.]|uniref:VanZ family protein n=1 Tax=uncultured Chryseobacterium sp. TaxID=259322 RepID=UPI0025F7237C|nr:VanZ family protein [uncultured Chryseobacterium sp.]
MLKKFYQFIIYPYTFFLLYLMLFGFGRIDARYPDPALRLEPVISTVQFMKSGLPKEYIVKIVLGNIIMFIPFGFLGWSFPRLRLLKSLLFAFLSAIIIVEALQYFSRLGIFEVDDVILNTFGVFLGWKICRYIEIHHSRFIAE